MLTDSIIMVLYSKVHFKWNVIIIVIRTLNYIQLQSNTCNFLLYSCIDATNNFLQVLAKGSIATIDTAQKNLTGNFNNLLLSYTVHNLSNLKEFCNMSRKICMSKNSYLHTFLMIKPQRFKTSLPQFHYTVTQHHYIKDLPSETFENLSFFKKKSHH